jgi:hypothetical protein
VAKGVLKKGDMVFIERKQNCWLGNAMLHIVRKDETLHSLAQSYGIRARKLARLNSLPRGEEFVCGQTIKLR